MIDAVRDRLRREQRRWLVTGVAGFIGSNLLEELLNLQQVVVGVDNFATGHRRNLEDVKNALDDSAWSRFTMIEGDITDISICRASVTGIDYVLHQAALGSVPRSIEDPIATNRANVDGFLNMLVASRDAKVKRFVYAASSSTYGDHPALPKKEDAIGKPLSPYAVTKYVNELYADVFSGHYGLESIGLRYFNVFGRRQDPNGAYAAVIPRWIRQLMHGDSPTIYGDGETSRDFCYIHNAVAANILASVAERNEALNQVYNVAVGQRTTLNELFMIIREVIDRRKPGTGSIIAKHDAFRKGDVRHSQADISKAAVLLGYRPSHDVRRGLEETIEWYYDHRIE